MSEEYAFEHEPERQRFTAVRHSDGRRIGEAHYRLLGDDGIDFDHTVVDPAARGKGLASELVRTALTSDLVSGRTVIASCPFVAAFIARNPELG